ncbi:hypothetical protein PLICRDRAFT_579311 [Plicaturopsis crispa FD-325 SS-3]|nr:hypothetical protein PLICRDRAFT_579311 [Plicaturopsis crispa FD-325 SS-3]
MPSLPTVSRAYRLPKFEGIQSLTLSQIDVPPLKATEVLVKIHAVSLNFRDLITTKGQYFVQPNLNSVPGADSAGEIIALGADLLGPGAKWAVGDRVNASIFLDYIHGDVTLEYLANSLGAPGVDGTLTEYRAFPAHALVKIPEHLSYEEAATLPGAALTSYSSLLGPAPLKGGDTVLVQGTGGVSIAALQFAVASGATVIATSSSDAKLEVAKKLGATHLINYKTTPDWDKEVLKITNGRGVDHILEIGGSGTIVKSLEAIRYGGHIYAIGFLAQDGAEANTTIRTIIKACHVHGVLIGSVSQFEAMNRLISARGIHPVVDKVFAFEDAAKAYEYFESQAFVGKVVIKVSKD